MLTTRAIHDMGIMCTGSIINAKVAHGFLSFLSYFFEHQRKPLIDKDPPTCNLDACSTQ